MTTFDEQIAAAVSSLFTTDSAGAETGTLNGDSVVCQVIDEGAEAEFNCYYDYIDVEFLNADYTAIDYGSDVFVIRGTTWKQPKLKKRDGFTTYVRFRSNIRPIGR